jgi:hypothetical protein
MSTYSALKADAPGAFLTAEVQFAKSWVFSKFGIKFYWERLPGAGFFSIKIKMQEVLTSCIFKSD